MVGVTWLVCAIIFCSKHGNVALDLNEFYLDWLPGSPALNKIPGSAAARAGQHATRP